MSQRITNINGKSIQPCKCGSWLKHWENISGEQAGACAEVTCGKLASEGAFVQKSVSQNGAWYIVPLCPKHNAIRGGSLEIVGYIPLVSVTTEKTCEP